MRFLRWLRALIRLPALVGTALTLILERLDIMTAKLDELLNQIDTATNVLAAKQDKLIAELAAAKAAGDPVTDEQLARMTAIRDHLQALGADPANPVPAPPVDVPATPPAI